jgi:hydrogenase-4 component F
MPAFLPYLLLAVPAIAALVCLAPAPALLAERVSAIAALALLGLGIWLVVASGAIPVRAGSLLYVDALSAILILVIGMVGGVALLYSLGYVRREVTLGHFGGDQVRWYYLWLHLFILCMLLVALAANLGMLWVAMECTTVLSGVLVGFYRTPEALEAAWKYVVICSLGIALALFGTVLMYYSAVQVLGQGTGALDWSTLRGAAPHLDHGLVRLSFAFVLVGFGTKAGLAPMHTWLPDAHSQAPSPVSALLSAVLLNCALYAILRYHALALVTLGPDFSTHLLLAFGLISVAVAVPFLIIQHDVKRLLAYSSMEHVGIITAAAGIGGKLGLFAALLHLVNHAAAKTAMFLGTGTLIQRLGTRNLARLNGAGRTLPGLAALLLLGALALAGSPPFSLFVSEFSAVRAAFVSDEIYAGAILLALLALAFGGLLAHLGRISLGAASRRARGAGSSPFPATVADRFGIAGLVLPVTAVVLLGLHVPDGLVTLLRHAAGVVGGA